MEKIYLLLITSSFVAGSMEAQQVERLPFPNSHITEKSAPQAVVYGAKTNYRDMSNEDSHRGGPACQLDEDFDGGFPSGWTNIANNANENWEYLATNGNPNGHMNIAYDLGLQNESLLTPPVDLTTISAPTLKFDWFMSYYWGVAPNDNYDLTVSVSTNGGINWTPLWTESDEGEFDSYTWYTKNVDLSAYATQSSVVFLFNYNGSDGAQAKFDNISVCSAQNDLRVDVVLTGDIVNDYAYSQIPASQASQVIAGAIYSNAGGTTQTNVSVDSETFSFVMASNVSTGTVPGLTSIAPGESDTVWISTGFTPAQIDTLAQTFIVSSDQTDVTPLDNEDVQFLLITSDTWAHDYELEDYYAFGYASGGAVGSSGFEMGASYFCQTSGGTIYAVDFPLGSNTTATVVTVNIYENSLLAGPVSSTVYDILPGDLSTTAVNFINVPLDNPVAMLAGNAYTATIAIEAGDDAYILGNNLDDGDGGHVLYSVDDDTWYNWVGLTTAMRLRVSSVVGADETNASSPMNVYPNPAAENVGITFTSNESGSVKLDVLSSNGSLVYTETVSVQAGMQNNVSVDLREFTSGIYLVQLDENGVTRTARFAVQ